MTPPEYASAQGWHTAQGLFTREAYFALFQRHGLRLGAERGWSKP